MESVNRWAIQSNLFDCISIDADIFSPFRFGRKCSNAHCTIFYEILILNYKNNNQRSRLAQMYDTNIKNPHDSS